MNATQYRIAKRRGHLIAFDYGAPRFAAPETAKG
jgi:hypothetical protein